MLNRRSLLAGVLGAAALGRVVTAAESTPDASPGASPSASPEASPAGGEAFAVVGEGRLDDPDAEITFTIDLRTMSPDATPEGTFTIQNLDADPELIIEPLELISLKSVSAASPHIKRLMGYATASVSQGEYPFVLEMEDSGDADSGKDSINFVMGYEAEPFFGDMAKPGCVACGGYSFALRSNVVEGDIEISE